MACSAASDTFILLSAVVRNACTVWRAESQQLQPAAGDESVGARHAVCSCRCSRMLFRERLWDYFDEMASGLLKAEKGSAEHESE